MKFKWLGILILTLVGCYSFKGIAIPDEATTFYVVPVENISGNIVPGLSESFTEALKDKIRSETRLTYDNVNPDIIFEGAIIEYKDESKAPTANRTSAYNQLIMSVRMSYDYAENKDDGWTDRRFSRQEDFEATQDLISIQESLNELLINQLLEDIFNAAFAESW